jgi:hypothetical protein
MVPGPAGYYQESYTVTCAAADGTLLETSTITIDKGQTVNLSLCTPDTVPATFSLTLGGGLSWLGRR